MITIDNKKYFTMIDVQKLTKKPFYSIQYVINAGHIEKPLQIMGRRLYTQKNIDDLNEYFKRKVDKNGDKN